MGGEEKGEACGEEGCRLEVRNCVVQGAMPEGSLLG